MRRLLAAAGRGGGALISEAGGVLGPDGWAVVVDPLAGPVLWSAPEAAALAAHVVAGGSGPAGSHSVPVAGAVLVLGGGTAEDRELAAETVAGLLTVRARRAAELADARERLHEVLVRLLLGGEAALVWRLAGVPQDSVATVYRLAGTPSEVSAARRAVWRSLLPGVEQRKGRALISVIDEELAVIVLGGTDGDGWVLALMARCADRYGLTGGVADPVPVPLLGPAWAEAGQAQQLAGRGQVAPAMRLGERSLFHAVDPRHAALWAATLLRPLDARARLLLEVYLRGTVTGTAAELGISRNSVRTAVNDIAGLLGTDLRDPVVRARVLLALRVPAPAAGEALPDVPVDPARDGPAGLLTDLESARKWAAGITGGLDDSLAETLTVWFGEAGQAAPAALRLGIDRRTLAARVDRARDLLGADLDDPGVRAEVALALSIQAGARCGTSPDGAPGHGDWLTRAGLR